MTKITLVKSLNGHTSKVWCLDIHNNLPLLATGSEDKTSIVYDLNSYEVVSRFSDTHKKSIRSVSWKPSGRFPCLAAGSFDSTMSIWAKTDEDFDMDDEDNDDEGTSSNKQWSLMAIIEGHENEIKAVAWSQDGQQLASCSRDKTIWIWEADDFNEEFECVNVLQDYHTQDIKTIKWGPNGYLISASYDDTVKIFKEGYDSDEMACVCDLNAHDATVWSVDLEKGKNDWRFCSSSDDSTIKVWKRYGEQKNEETEDWKQQAVLPIVHKGPIYCVSWSPNSGRIASVGSDSKVVVYEEVEGGWKVQATKELAHGVFELNCVIWVKQQESTGTERLITGADNGTINIWEVEL